jgi:hypothetical protein
LETKKGAELKKDVLILADGIVAKHLLARILKDTLTSNRYHIVHREKGFRPIEYSENFLFYHFDPTSFPKLSKLFEKYSYQEVVVVLGTRFDTEAAFENIRKLDKNVSVVLLDKWGLGIDDKDTISIKANEILANRLFDYLPDVPVIAQNVGLGEGEIMEVLVPFGSSYVYRHIGTIEQNKWRIAAIYRNGRLILPASDLMIYPNDLLLLVGEPEVLKYVFKSIRQEVGQFPLPYGSHSYLFVDMAKHPKEFVRHMLQESIYLHHHLNNKKLYIRVVNPNDFELLDLFKDHDGNDGVEVMIDYRHRDSWELFQADIADRHIGLILVDHELFGNREWREFLYGIHLPVLLLSKAEFATTKEAALILKPDVGLEKISAPLFDLSIQLALAITIYEDPALERDETIRHIIEHYQNLAHIFSKPLYIKKTKTNVVRELMGKDGVFAVFPFTQDVVRARKNNLFCTDPLRLFFRFHRSHLIFIPPGEL